MMSEVEYVDHLGEAECPCNEGYSLDGKWEHASDLECNNHEMSVLVCSGPRGNAPEIFVEEGYGYCFALPDGAFHEFRGARLGVVLSAAVSPRPLLWLSV